MGSVEDALQDIDAALDEGDFEAALELAGAAIVTFPADADVRVAYGEALWTVGEIEAAREAFETAVRLAPESAPCWAGLACLRFDLIDFAGAREAAQRAQKLEASPEALDVLCRLAERDGDLEEADVLARRAHALDAGYPLPYRVDAAEFQRLVTSAVEEIPESFQEALAGEVAILVRAVPPLELLQGGPSPLDPALLLGLYVGTPLTERSSDFAALPDQIYLFQHNLEHAATSRKELVEQIRITVFHEVGHYFGFSDAELEERDFG